jgi:hypothetical protein
MEYPYTSSSHELTNPGRSALLILQDVDMSQPLLCAATWQG